MKHDQPIHESRPPRRAFTTPDATASAEKPMSDPTVTQGLPIEEDREVNRPAPPPSAETPMEPPTASQPKGRRRLAKQIPCLADPL